MKRFCSGVCAWFWRHVFGQCRNDHGVHGCNGFRVYTTPLATLKVTDTQNAAPGYDAIAINLASWLVPAYETGGRDSVGAEVVALGGTWTAVGSGAQLYLPTGIASHSPQG